MAKRYKTDSNTLQKRMPLSQLIAHFTVNNSFYRQQKLASTVNKSSCNLLIISVTVNTVINFAQFYITKHLRHPLHL